MTSSPPTLRRMSDSVKGALGIKPFDLEPVFISWLNAPRFTGNTKKDMPIDDWLKKIKEGCVERNVPKDYWYKVGEYYLSGKAKSRLSELKKVMDKMHGGYYRWTWKKFKIAMRNMGWGQDASETVKVHSKKTGLWWVTRKSDCEKSIDDNISQSTNASRPSLSSRSTFSATSTSSGKSGSTDSSGASDGSMKFWLARKTSGAGSSNTSLSEVSSTSSKDTKNSKDKGRPVPERSKSSFWLPSFGNNSDEQFVLVDEPEEICTPGVWSGKRPVHTKAASDSSVKTKSLLPWHDKPAPPLPTPDETVTAQVPTWLLNASNALGFLQNEHPKVMTAISAILITVGSIPAIPAIHAGAGGALLATGAAQALGAIAVGVGQLMNPTLAPEAHKEKGGSHH